VRSGPFVGVIDEMGVARAELATADRRQVADEIVEHLATSARNKGCTRVEVSEPLASAEPSLWKRHRFASRGRSLGRTLA
jgi:quinol monooxygenase YgiN